MSDHKSPPRDEDAKPTHLIPDTLTHLLKEKPVLWFEDPDDYDALLSSIFSELDPKGATEAILVKDVVDYVWEIRRMRRIKTAALQDGLPAAAAHIMGSMHKKMQGRKEDGAGKDSIEDITRAASSGSPDALASLSKVMQKSSTTKDLLLHRSYAINASMITHLSHEAERLERRRDQIMKMFHDRRSSLKAMARDVIKREEAQVITLPSSS